MEGREILLKARASEYALSSLKYAGNTWWYKGVQYSNTGLMQV